MNFVDMEIYNRLYKEIVPSDEYGGTNLSINPIGPGYGETFYQKFAYKANGKIKITIPFVLSITTQIGSTVVVTVEKNGNAFIEERVTVRPAGVFEREIEVTPSDVFELTFTPDGNTYVSQPGIEITAYLIDKIEKFAKFE